MLLITRGKPEKYEPRLSGPINFTAVFVARHNHLSNLWIPESPRADKSRGHKTGAQLVRRRQQNIIVFGFDLWWTSFRRATRRYFVVCDDTETSTPPLNNVRSGFNRPASELPEARVEYANSDCSSPVVLRLVVTWERP